MNSTQAALYARVSSAQQAEAHTVASQVVALRERIAADGLPLSEALQFIDEGYRGATLVRPALERLRDLATAGAVDRLYVHSPDRLARTYAYQVLLVDEFQRVGVEVMNWLRVSDTAERSQVGSVLHVMLAKRFRATVDRKRFPHQRRSTASDGHQRRVSTVSVSQVQEKWPHSQR
jgi:site-specific DNA recombinase